MPILPSYSLANLRNPLQTNERHLSVQGVSYSLAPRSDLPHRFVHFFGDLGHSGGMPSFGCGGSRIGQR
jgi:hypothetical protein